MRVVNSTVTSSRTGYVAGLLPVQTFRTDASTGSVVAVTNYVGGQNPAVADAGNGSVGTVMDTATGVFTAGIVGTAQSITNVALGGNLTGVDFGFNFDTIVNVNDSGQGSLRQFLTNANALANPGLAQAGRTSDIDNAVFEIPGPGPHTIAVGTWLPSITDPVVLDGTTQPGFSGTPILELDGSATTYDGLKAGLVILAGNSTVRGLVVNRFAVDGIRLEAGSNNVIEGNYIGTDISGLLDRGNAFDGVFIVGGSAGNRIGGLLPGQGNVISGNNDEGLDLRPGSATLIQGNLIGIAADGTTALGNVSDGVQITGGTGNAVTANRIAANGGLGIDLRDDGVTANDGATTAGQPNLLMDFPVFTSALLAGTSLTVSGYVGSAPGQATFANASVELFLADADPTGFGEGRTLLGTLTADGSGNLAGTLTVAGLTTGDRLTATATDPAGNTSEFGPNAIVGPFAISGTVFEDFELRRRHRPRPRNRRRLQSPRRPRRALRRRRRASSPSPSPIWRAPTPLPALPPAATASASSTPRSPPRAACPPCSPSRPSAPTPPPASRSRSPTMWGARSPASSMPATAPTTLAALTTATTTAQSVTPVTLGATDVTGVDFGFNFNTIVNVNDSGQGSLRQFVLNSNALGNVGLAIQGQPAGQRRVRVHDQRRSGAPGPARRHRQPAQRGGSRRDHARDRSAGHSGRGHVGRRHDPDRERRQHQRGRAGDGGHGRRGWSRAERGGRARGGDPRLGDARERAADPGRQRGRARPRDPRFRNRERRGRRACRRLPRRADREQRAGIERDVVHRSRSRRSATRPASTRSGGSNGTVRNNLIGFGRVTGVNLNAGTTGWTITGNEIRDNGMDTADGDGITINASSTNTSIGNLITGSSSQGLRRDRGARERRTCSPTTRSRATASESRPASRRARAITLRSGATSTVLDRNVIRANYGAGVQVNDGSTGTRMTRNSFALNGTITARNGCCRDGADRHRSQLTDRRHRTSARRPSTP